MYLDDLEHNVQDGVHIMFCGRRLRIEVTTTEATYRLLEGSPLHV